MNMPRSLRSVLVLGAGAPGVMAFFLPAQAAGVPRWRVDATISVPGKSTALTTVDAVSSRDAWAFGATGGARERGVVRHWNGKTWAVVALPAKIAAAWGRDVPDFVVAGASRRSVLAFSTASSGDYLRLNGKRWSLGRLPGINGSVGYDISGVRVFTATDAWAFGTKFADTKRGWRYSVYAAHFDGRGWTQVPVAGKAAAVQSDLTFPTISAVSRADVWGIGGSSVLRWTDARAGFRKAAVQPPLARGSALTAILAERNGTVWVAGVRYGINFAASWNGHIWALNQLPAPAASRNYPIISMAADGHGGLWALGINARAHPPASRLWHFAAGAWTGPGPERLGHAPFLIQLAAVPGTSSVWAVGAAKKGSDYYGLIALSGPEPR